MSGFKIKKSKDVQEERDIVGGGGAWDSNVYQLEVVNAYLHTSDEGAQALALEVKTPEGRTQKQMHYVTTKSGDNYYTDSKDNKKHLPGFLIANALAILASEGEAEIDEFDTEDRIIQVWDSNAGAEVNKTVPVFYDLIGLEFQGGIIKVSKPKSVKQNDNTYKDDPEQIVEINEMDKVFSIDGFTTLELMNETDEPKFIEQWLKRWEGKVKTVKPKEAAKTRGGRTGAATTKASAGRGNAAAGGAKKSFFKK